MSDTPDPKWQPFDDDERAGYQTDGARVYQRKGSLSGLWRISVRGVELTGDDGAPLGYGSIMGAIFAAEEAIDRLGGSGGDGASGTQRIR